MTPQSRAVRSQCPKIVKFGKFMALIFLKCKSTSDLTDIPALIYDRKTVARRFDTIYNILRPPSLVQSLLTGQNAPIGRKLEPTHMRLSGTDGLKNYSAFFRYFQTREHLSR